MKNRKMLPGCHPPTADALGEPTRAAGAAVRDTPPDSRRAGTEPSTPLTRPDTAADITGGAASTASTTTGLTAPPSAVPGESSTATTEPTDLGGPGRADESAAPGTRTAGPRPPDPLQPGREAPRDAWVDPDPDDLVDAEPDDLTASDDPVVSAKATGTAATAEPTPNATANAPTRPTYAAKPRAAGPVTPRTPYSIDRTLLSAIRR